MTQNDLEYGNLPKDSMIRVDKIYSLSQLIVVKSLGEITQETFARIVTVLNRLVTSNE